MSVIALVTAGKVRVVESRKQLTLPTAETIAPGDAVRLDTTTGKFTKANGSSSGEARAWGVAVSNRAGVVTAVADGVIEGFDLAALAYDADVYLSDTDGKLDTAAGTVSKIVGRVIPATGVTLGTAYDKLLEVKF